MQVTYCRRWNFRRHRPIDDLTAEQARSCDDNHEVYSVALGDPNQPEVVIEVDWRNDHLGVWFFEKNLRQSVSYLFRRVNETTMFLHQIGNWRYDDDSADTLSGARVIETFRYGQDGVGQRSVVNKDANERTMEERSNINVDSHWEPVPRFGDWTSVARYDRDHVAA